MPIVAKQLYFVVGAIDMNLNIADEGGLLNIYRLIALIIGIFIFIYYYNRKYGDER